MLDKVAEKAFESDKDLKDIANVFWNWLSELDIGKNKFIN